jgi:hypothetical protein
MSGWNRYRAARKTRPRRRSVSCSVRMSSDRRADACRAAGSLRRITALGLKRFIAGLSCDALASPGKSGDGPPGFMSSAPLGKSSLWPAHGAVHASCCAVGPIDCFGGAAYLAGLAAHSRFDGRHC